MYFSSAESAERGKADLTENWRNKMEKTNKQINTLRPGK